MTEADAIDLLMTHEGEALAATAWEGFLAAGRGCVATDGRFHAAYFPESLLHRLPAVGRKVKHLVGRYDPSKQIVVVLLVKLTSGDFMAAVGKRIPALSPEECFLKHVGSPGMPPMQVVPVPVPEEAR